MGIEYFSLPWSTTCSKIKHLYIECDLWLMKAIKKGLKKQSKQVFKGTGKKTNAEATNLLRH